MRVPVTLTVCANQLESALMECERRFVWFRFAFLLFVSISVSWKLFRTPAASSKHIITRTFTLGACTFSFLYMHRNRILMLRILFCHKSCR